MLTKEEMAKVVEVLHVGVQAMGLNLFANDGGKLLQEALAKLEKQVDEDRQE